MTMDMELEQFELLLAKKDSRNTLEKNLEYNRGQLCEIISKKSLEGKYRKRNNIC